MVGNEECARGQRQRIVEINKRNNLVVIKKLPTGRKTVKCTIKK